MAVVGDYRKTVCGYSDFVFKNIYYAKINKENTNRFF